MLEYGFENENFIFIGYVEDYISPKGRHFKKCKVQCKHCGKILEIRENKIKTQKSCGCINAGRFLKNNKFGERHGKSNSRIYNIYKGMLKRCYNEKDVNYVHYGKRGVSVCEEWRNDFLSFYNWSMENGYEENLTIDRIDVNGNYEPSNCKWSTMKEQANNKTNNVYLTINNETQTLTQMCEKYNVDNNVARKVINKNTQNKESIFYELMK